MSPLFMVLFKGRELTREKLAVNSAVQVEKSNRRWLVLWCAIHVAPVEGVKKKPGVRC